MDDWITTTEAAQISGYHPDHIRRLTRAGKIEAKKFGIVWQVSSKSLFVYMNKIDEKGGKRGPKSGEN